MIEKLRNLENGTPLIVVYPSGNEMQAIFCDREGDKYYFFDGTIFSFSEAFIKKRAVSFIFDKLIPKKLLFCQQSSKACPQYSGQALVV